MNTGRPTARTESLDALILADIAAGCSEHIAAEANGVPRSTWNGWKALDEGLSDRCSLAKAQSVKLTIAQLNALPLAEKTNPDYTRWRLHLLGCRDRELSARQQIEHTGGIAMTIADVFAQGDAKAA